MSIIEKLSEVSPLFIVSIGMFALFLLMLLFFVSRYKRCRPDRILIISGRVSEDPNERFIVLTSGSAFVWPVIQDYTYLDASPKYFSLSGDANTKDNQSGNYQINLIVKISTREEQVKIAAELFAKKKTTDIDAVIEAKLMEAIQETIIEKRAYAIKENYAKLREDMKKSLAEYLEMLGCELVAVKDLSYRLQE